MTACVQMNVEVATVFDYAGAALYWTSTLDAGSMHIPDSRALWDFIWDHRKDIHGIAHSHSGGMDMPSGTDVTTWGAVERGLGVRLWWPIVTEDQVTCYHHNPVTGGYEHTRMVLSSDVTSDVWRATIDQLRKKSCNPYLGANDDGHDYDNS